MTQTNKQEKKKDQDFKKLAKHNYIERDLSWMYFNHRILDEAKKDNVPLLERLKFLGIYSNNLDEFFRVRIASLNSIANSDDEDIKKEERHKAKDLAEQICCLNTSYAKEFEQTKNDIMAKLKQEGIVVVNETELNEQQQEYVKNFYDKKLNGLINPVWISSISRLDKENDYNIYLAIRLTHLGKNKTEREYALIEEPVSKVGRFIELPDCDGHKCIIFLDDVIRFCLPKIFVGLNFDVYEAYSFKFTRNAELEIDSDVSHSKVQKISKSIKGRKRGEPLRVIYEESMPKELLKRLMAKFHLNKLDTVLPSDRYHNNKDLMSFPSCGRTDLMYPARTPMMKADLDSDKSILDLIREKDRFVHVPYHSFDSYLRVLREASLNPDVKSIKTTIYRLAKDSKVVKALICAAQNGKKVTVVIELMARFDEEENIDWSQKMEEAGIEVLFGLDGLKIHSKLTFIEAKQGNIACISSGNFHEGNAKTYTDYILMTGKKSIVKDVENVFEFIQKPYAPFKFKELLLSPNHMRDQIIEMLDNEIKNAKNGKPAYFMGKVNHITDEEMVNKLYEASTAGVKIDLVVRGNCSLVTGVEGLSENIHVVGIIDRYLEHSRILIFANGGDEKYYLGSSDWMPRNFDSRIEAMVPVYNYEIQRDLKRTVTYGLKDSMQGRIVDGTGRNLPLVNADHSNFNSQNTLFDDYKRENEEYIAAHCPAMPEKKEPADEETQDETAKAEVENDAAAEKVAKKSSSKKK